MPKIDPQRVRFVLVEPRFAGNVGSAARAMKNLGFRRLVLVRPREGPDAAEARRLAVEAVDLLDAAKVEESLEAALDDAQSVVGTTARRGRQRSPHWRLDELVREPQGAALSGEVAFVFGREDRGLTDRELDRCTHLVRLYAAQDYPTFNLAQAVLVVAYELALAGAAPAGPASAEAGATQEQREAMYRHLARALTGIGFLKREPHEVIMRRLRRILGRAGLTSREVRTLRGLARQLEWVAERASRAPRGG